MHKLLTTSIFKKVVSYLIFLNCLVLTDLFIIVRMCREMKIGTVHCSLHKSSHVPVLYLRVMKIIFLLCVIMHILLFYVSGLVVVLVLFFYVCLLCVWGGEGWIKLFFYMIFLWLYTKITLPRLLTFKWCPF